MYNPIFIDKFHIWDIFHNNENNLVIICPVCIAYKKRVENNLDILYEGEYFSQEFNQENISTCEFSYIFVLKRKTEYRKNIQLTIKQYINDEEISTTINTEVNKYPTNNDKIIMSTMVKDEDNYIKQWIIFHNNIGVSHFVIYDNSGSNTLKYLLKDFIDDNLVTLINWSYSKQKYKGFRGTHLKKMSLIQSPQQTHSIWAFKNCKYIGMFDIDEYINIQKEKNIYDFFNNLIINKEINVDEISGFEILNKFFYNPNKLPTDNFEFLKIYNCSEIIFDEEKPNYHQKLFIIPKNTHSMCMHQIIFGKKKYIVSSDEIFFNHYYFLNKNKRGLNKTKLQDNSIEKHTINLK